MGRIMLFGSSTITGVPSEVNDWLFEYARQGHEFIVGDCKGADSAFHKVISSVGALEKSTIYCMGEARNNKYDLKVRSFITNYDSETKIAVIRDKETEQILKTIEEVEKEMDVINNRQYYEFKDRQMVEDCDAAIALWNGESRGTLHVIQLLNIKNKPCYSFTF